MAGFVALQKPVGAMFDHTPGRQIGQFVIIGRPEQLILEGLLLADVGGARKQQVAIRDTNRAMAGEKDLFHRAAGEAFFRNGGAPGAEQFDTVLTAVIQFPREGPAGASPSWAAAASFISRKRPCSS